MRLRLRLSIAAAAILIIVPLTGSIVGFLYVRNAEMALSLAKEEMDKAAAKLADHLEGLLNPVARVVEATAVMARLDRTGLHRVESLRFFLTMLKDMPQADSIYIGFGQDGAFYQAARLEPGVEQFGPSGSKPPARAKFVLRLLDSSSGDLADSYLYLADWGDIVGVERAAPTYDPRLRPWYGAAWQQPSTALSDAYIFSASRKPGITLSHRVATDDGTEIGAVGMDISLAVLSDFLSHEKVGRKGLVFILDDEERLVGHPRAGMGVAQSGDHFELLKASEVADPLVAAAAREWSAHHASRFAMQISGKSYLVSFTPIAEGLGNKLVIGAIVAEDDFIGPLRRASLQMIGFATCILALALVGVVLCTGMLTRPVHEIVDETNRIREFDLSGRFNTSSSIIEIEELAQAVKTMKNGLASFGAYVPKALVRTIVASGRSIEIGGERRSLTIMFTDIENFSMNAEARAPEAVLRGLSRYFELMSECIHETGGTVDKFIGDAVMAFWNAPLDDDDHVANACKALLACGRITEMYREEFAASGLQRTRFGLHTGDAVVGNVGSAERTQYTALGDTVNLASRIEGLNKYYGTALLVTSSVAERVPGQFLFRSVDVAIPVGMSRPIQVFELLAETAPGDARLAKGGEFEWLADWENAVMCYRSREWKQAATLLREFEQTHFSDKLVQVYRDRCDNFLKEPPPPDWDGAEHYDRK